VPQAQILTVQTVLRVMDLKFLMELPFFVTLFHSELEACYCLFAPRSYWYKAFSIPRPFALSTPSAARSTSPAECTPLAHSVPPFNKMTVTVQLFYEPTKAMVDDFQVNSFESHGRILKNIGTRFGFPFIAAYSQDAKQQIDDLRDVYQGQILLVTNSPTTRPRPYPPYGFKLYQFEEAAYVHSSVPKKPWTVISFDVRKVRFITDKVKGFSELEKKKHILSVGANKPEIRNMLRITEPYGAFVIELDRLKVANSQQLAATHLLVLDASRDKMNLY
jgi:hypothetical protein